MIERLLAPGSLRMHYQPMYRCGADGVSLFALEALARGPASSHFEHAAVLFDYVRLKRAEVAADRACIAEAFRSVPQLPPGVLLSVNVHACTLERDAGFPSWVLARAGEAGLDSTRLVLEIVEQGRYWNRAKLAGGLRELRAAGVRLALDDLGAGTCNFSTILDTRPDYLKIDAYIVQGCANDPFRSRTLEAIHRLAGDFGALAVAEGIETESDLEAVCRIGIEVAQGFFLGRPLPPSEFPALTSPLLKVHPHTYLIRGEQTHATQKDSAGRRLKHDSHDGTDDSDQGPVRAGYGVER